MTDQAVDTDGVRLSQDPDAESGFLGRTRELKELRADIERAGLDTLSGRKAPRARVLLIAGRPGSGRTALAEELAARVAHDYPDGVLRARLSEPDGTRVPVERLARELLTALERTAPPGADEDDLTEALRTALADRRALLLLDAVADAEQVDALLPDTPDCLAVAVAEGPLTGIADVRPCTLGGLDTKSAVELLSRHTGSVRITVDPRAAEQLVELCQAQPAALTLAGGWLAARPQAAVADLAKHVHAESDETGALGRVFGLVYASLPGTAARMLRLLSLAPAGLVDPHTASALAGCSVSGARTTLDDFVAHGLLRAVDSALPEYEVPGCLHGRLGALARKHDRPAELQLARARMLERTVRLLQSCRAVTETDSPQAREKLLATPRDLRFPHPRAAADWLRARRPALLAAARLAVADGELDTLARRLMSQLVRAMVAHFGTRAAAPDLYGIHRLVLDVAERRELPRERAAALLNLADLDARTGRTAEAAGALPGRAGRRTGGEGPVRDRPRAGIRRRRPSGAGGLRPGRRLVRPGPRRAPRPGRARRRRPGLRPSRHRPYLRRTLRRGGTGLARGRLRTPQGRRRGRARAGAGRAGPRPGVRRAARGVAAHLPGGRRLGPPGRGRTAPGRAAPAARRHARPARRPHRGGPGAERGRTDVEGRSCGRLRNPQHSV
ncbi:putative regulatory protein [Streptomyces lividans 1326]|uniref:Putative regulatory protein n=1 Tax=Streptomyces lividans 1326 TaxID=1200984 RepID=A0A7U9DTH1_STRLI|nr:putative regulatory protein [Streptomyces lividans 1326]